MNKNTVELLGFYGSDEIVAQSAWTSTSRDITDAKRERIPDLLEMLWSNHHETPFEKVTVHFLVDTEIASHIHLLKHRMANINGESARYKELKEDKYYLPEDWKNIKSSDNYLNKLLGTEDWYNLIQRFSVLSNDLYHAALVDLTPLLGRKRAKESARFFKTYNSQIQADITFNMRSFANFIKLRNSKNAQLEIREVAQQMWNLVQNETEGKFENILKVIDDRIKFEEKCEKYKDLINGLE